MAFQPQERAYYDQLFAIVDKDRAGVLPGQDALPFLVSSGLPQQTLGEVWAVADPDNNGFLTKEAWYKAARLIGWAQKGGKTTIDDSLANQPGPYPSFQGHPPPPPQTAPLSAQGTGSRMGAAPMSAQTTGSGGLPPLTAADRTKFTRIFVGCGPQNGLVSGDKARDVFVKSQLGYDKLGQIWNLADTQQRGSLDLPDFIIGMYLIQACMANPSLNLPATLPHGTYEQASGGRPAPASPVVRQNTGAGAAPASPLRAQYTGGTLQPQRTGQSLTGVSTANPPRPAGGFTAQPPAQPAFAPRGGAFGTPTQQQWDVTPDAKATSDRFFAQLDPQNKGVIEGDVAVPFMLQSQLDEGTLANIWDLADIKHEGKLDRDQFAVAMHLINEKLAGREVPSVLPNSLIPPSLRGSAAVTQNASGGTGSITKDLFDLFDDPPVATPATAAAGASAFPSVSAQPQAPAQPTQAAAPGGFNAAAFMPQPPSRKPSAPTSRGMSPAPAVPAPTAFGMGSFATQMSQSPAPPSDLLGDDANDSASAARSVPDNSAEYGNKQNQYNNTSKALAEAEKTRADLEKSASSSGQQLAELEEKLSTARVKHEAEVKAVADLRIRVGEQTAKITELNKQVISAESDLTAMRLEKDELGQALLRDKEEVRGLQKRMKEIEDEKTGLKLVLEKLRKEARQQKGMVTIAKKQLSTAETSRDSVQGEVRAVEQEIEEDKATIAAAEAKPKTASPAYAAPSEPFSPGGTLATAAATALPSTPKALSPTATGASSRSNNPFDRLANRSSSMTQSRSPPPVPSASETAASPVATTRELGREGSHDGQGIGATTVAAVGAAAGVVAAGAATLFGAAKDAVSAEEHKDAKAGEAETHHGEDAADPFGASAASKEGATQADTEEAHEQASGKDEKDPFGMPSNVGTSSTSAAAADPHKTDPFGAPAFDGPSQASGPSSSGFDDGFGDSFGTAKPATAIAAAHAQPSGATDFDSAFADFDKPESEPEVVHQSEPSQGDAMASQSGNDLPGGGLPSGIPKSAIPDSLSRPEPERSLSTQAIAPDSVPDSPIDDEQRTSQPPAARSALSQPATTAADGESSDEEDDGPEDLEGPKRSYSAAGQASRTEAGARQDADADEEDVFGDHSALAISTDLSAHHHDDGPMSPAGMAGIGAGAAAAAAGAAALSPPLPMSSAGAFGSSSAFAQSAASPTASEFDSREPKTRRSAPPPPASRNSGPAPTSAAPATASTSAAASGFEDDDFDPFGPRATSPSTMTGPATSTTTAHDPQPTYTSSAAGLSLPPGAAPADTRQQPKTAAFEDDDDFDFSDLPPAQVDASGAGAGGAAAAHGSAPAAGFGSHAFDDEFSGFDDEFDKPEAASSQGSKSYEMVSPNVPASATGPAASSTITAAPAGPSGQYDAWGFGGSSGGQATGSGAASAAPAAGQAKQPFSFDDAFGGDFEPSTGPSAQQQPQQQHETYAPPPGPPPSSSAPSGQGATSSGLTAPQLPQRRESGTGPQADDIEDVKKLCAMGFPRNLVVEALDANGYDFQKTLNVLLQ